MGKKLLFLLLSLTICLPYVKAQTNLVPNPSFEDTNACPTALGGIDYSDTYSSFPTVKSWVSPIKQRKADYYNACSSLMGVPSNIYSYQPAHTGYAYAGVWAWIDSFTTGVPPTPHMGYVECKLTSPLTSGKKYTVSFYANLAPVKYAANNIVVGINKLAAHFSDTLVYTPTDYNLNLSSDMVNLGTIVTDTTNWVRIGGNYTADGSEKYLTIGFFNNSLPLNYTIVVSGTSKKVSYTYIDDVSVTLADSIILDTSICATSFPITLYGDTLTGTYKWSTGATTANITITDTGIYWRRTLKDTLYYDDTFKVVKPKSTGLDTIICAGNFPLTLHGSKAPSGSVYQWNNSSSGDTLIVNDTGTYWRKTSGYSCVNFTDTFKVRRLKTIGIDTTICAGTFPTTITGENIPGTYLWNNGAVGASISVSDSGKYWRVTTAPPCVHYTDTIRVKRQQIHGFDTTICTTSFPVDLTGTAPYYASTYQWNTGATVATIAATGAGTYWRITTSPPCTNYTDTFKVYMSYTHGLDTTICNPAFPLAISGSPVPGRYIWNTGDTSATITTNAIGTYWRRTISPPCTDFVDSIRLKVTPALHLGNDSEYCYGTTVTLSPDNNYNHYSWNNGDTTKAIAVTTAGQYILTGSDACGSKSDTINISFYPQVPLPHANDTTVCENTQPPILNVTGTDLQWYTSNTSGPSPVQPTINTSVTGEQTLYITQTLHNCESDKKLITVAVITSPIVQLGNDTIICTGSQLLLGVPIDSTIFKWNTGENVCCIDVKKAGEYVLNATNVCGTSTDSINIEVLNCQHCLWTPSAFTPNGDGKNDIFRARQMCPLKEYEMRIYDRWGELVFISKDINYGWDGIYNGKPVDVGTYYYAIEFYTDIPNGSRQILKGDLILIR